MARLPDLEPTSPAALPWDAPGDRVSSLETLRARAVGSAESASRWYRDSRRAKRRWATGLRVGAVVALGVATIAPLLGEIARDAGATGVGHVLGHGLVTSACAAIAGLLVLADRFSGSTTGWVRYVTAAQRIDSALEEFHYRWQARAATVRGLEAGGPTGEDVAALVELARGLVADTHGVVRDETQAWAVEFDTVLRQLEAKASSASARPGVGLSSAKRP